MKRVCCLLHPSSYSLQCRPIFSLFFHQRHRRKTVKKQERRKVKINKSICPLQMMYKIFNFRMITNSNLQSILVMFGTKWLHVLSFHLCHAPWWTIITNKPKLWHHTMQLLSNIFLIFYSPEVDLWLFCLESNNVATASLLSLHPVNHYLYIK